jgi:solute carrier family 10 (sodium/bile acid cotransporter), member 7
MPFAPSLAYWSHVRLRGGALGASDSSSAAHDVPLPEPEQSLPTSPPQPPLATTPAKRLRAFASRNFFVLGMVAAVTLARLGPAWGLDGGILRPELVIGKYGVALIFLLSGLALEPSQIASAMSNVKLLGIVQLLSFGVWPLVGLAIRYLLKLLPHALFTPALADGVLMVSTLPTTVNMCVILTGSANGNVASSLCNAAIGNVIGVLLTPAILLRMFGSKISVPLVDMLLSLASKVALPVCVGQLLRLTPAKYWYDDRASFFKRTQEVILLSILWNAFCTAFSSDIGLAWSQLATLSVLLPLLHWAAFEAVFRLLSRPGLELSRQDVVAGSFCASQKTLAFGLPLLRTMFQGSPNLVSYCAPIMLIHPIQLVVGTFLLPKLRRYTSESESVSSSPASAVAR